jgi:hypothetical protein
MSATVLELLRLNQHDRVGPGGPGGLSFVDSAATARAAGLAAPVFRPYRATRTVQHPQEPLQAPSPALLDAIISESVRAGGWIDAAPVR